MNLNTKLSTKTKDSLSVAEIGFDRLEKGECYGGMAKNEHAPRPSIST